MFRSRKDRLHLAFNFLRRLDAFYKMTIEGRAEIGLRRTYHGHRGSSRIVQFYSVVETGSPLKALGKMQESKMQD